MAISADDWGKVSPIYNDLINLGTNYLGKIQEGLGARVVAAQKGRKDFVDQLDVSIKRLSMMKGDAQEISQLVSKYGSDWVQAAGAQGLGALEFLWGGLSSSSALSKVASNGPALVRLLNADGARINSIIQSISSAPVKQMTTEEALSLIKSTESFAASVSGGGMPLLGTFGIVALLGLGGLIYFKSRR